MTIEQLYYFYAISENGTFSTAAIEMNMTQSSLSKQIAKLEEELGMLLFDRSHRQITLTQEGEALLEDIKDILKSYEKFHQHVNELKDNGENTLKIAMFPIFSQYDLAKKINDFSKSHPDLHLHIDEIEERDIDHKLNYQDHDIYILRGDYELSHFHRILLYEDSLVCIVHKNHPLSHKKSISIHDLQDEKLLLPPKYTKITQLALEACHQAGFNPSKVRYGRNETILSAVGENEGIGIMMKKTLHVFHLSHMKVIPFKQDIHGDIFLYYTSYHKNHVNEFIQYIQPHRYKKS